MNDCNVGTIPTTSIHTLTISTPQQTHIINTVKLIYFTLLAIFKRLIRENVSEKVIY
uniref:Uncharacterized protein n=1 Tax=Geladintestivirus 1 TaxID=3233133 RepID=A0AAU8MI89_9CAUD